MQRNLAIRTRRIRRKERGGPEERQGRGGGAEMIARGNRAPSVGTPVFTFQESNFKLAGRWSRDCASYTWWRSRGDAGGASSKRTDPSRRAELKTTCPKAVVESPRVGLVRDPSPPLKIYPRRFRCSERSAEERVLYGINKLESRYSFSRRFFSAKKIAESKRCTKL